MRIKPLEERHLERLVALALRAWEPVFASLEQAMGPELFGAQHPDWRADQRRTVEAVCRDVDASVWIAEVDGEVAGFVGCKLWLDEKMGEIYLIGVDPAFQRRGIARELTRHALEWFREQGMTTVMVETGGDPGHAPARATYEAAGFRMLPIARYFKQV